MEEIPFTEPPLQSIQHKTLLRQGITLDVLRLDLIHPFIHGNKWFKLKYNLAYIQEIGAGTVLSFGGAWSNHLYALAAAGKHFRLKTVGVLRGELREPLNPVLSFARSQGMELVAISRADYRRKSEPEFIEELHRKLGDFHLIPEGGSNELAIKGCEEIIELIERSSWRGLTEPDTSYISVACGTAATMAGLVSGFAKHKGPHSAQVLGFSILKGEGYLARELEKHLSGLSLGNMPAWNMIEDYHCGGYAKSNKELLDFLQDFAACSDIPVEPVYTGKMMFGLFDMVEKGHFERGSRILAIHTGGVVA